MTDVRVVAFNANQHDNRAQITADLKVRCASADVVLLQELVNFDLARFAKSISANGAVWVAHQLDAGTNNGEANTAVLYRAELGPVEDSICLFVGKAHDTRARYLIGVKLGGVWYLSFHIFPRRDAGLIAEQLRILGGWLAEHPGEDFVIGVDKNTANVTKMESATRLTWHGGKVDPRGGILTNLKVLHWHEFPKGFSDHVGYEALVAVPAPKPLPRVFHSPSPEYVGPSPHVMHDAHGNPLPNMPLTRIVMHCTVSPCEPGGRYAIARLFKSPTGFSAHYITDPGGSAQMVFDHLVAEHAPPNPHSIGIEQCDPLSSEAWDKAHAGRWHDAPHQSMLHHSANLVARLCLAYDIPVRWLSTGQVAQNQKGICGHVNVSDAFHESTHWDPGPAFPVADFMAMVHRRVERLKAA